LGGGTAAVFSAETDWSDLGGNSQAGQVGTAQQSGFVNSENFVGLSDAKFGTLKFGTPNSFTLGNATSVASPMFSTAVGSAYSSKFSIANGLGTGATNNGGIVTAGGTSATAAVAGARAIRISNTVQYVTPNFSGFTAGVNYTPQNNNVTDSTLSGQGNTVGVTEYALRYTNGPVDAMYTSIKYDVGSNAVRQATMATSATSTSYALSSTQLAAQTSTQNLLGLSYQALPALKLNLGLGSFDSSDGANKGKSTQFGGTYTTGAWDILAQVAKVNDQSTTNADRKMTGLGVNYNLSKTTRVYFRADSIKYNVNSLSGFTYTATQAGDTLKRTALGMSVSF